MPAGYLRIPAEGPYAGNPPVFAGPDIASVIGHANGANSDVEFDPAAVAAVTWLSGGGPTAGVILSRNTRVGCRYLIEASMSIKAPSSSLSHLFTPRWNCRSAATGLWLSTDETAWTFGSGAKMTSPNNHSVTTTGQINTVHFRTLWTADSELDRFNLAVTSDDGVLPAHYMAQAQCFLTIWELGGVVP
jgi:hypothetical protein